MASKSHCVPFLLLLIICLIAYKKDDALTIYKESVSKNYLIPFNSILEQQENKYLALIYSPTCIACQSAIEVLSAKKKCKEFPLYVIDYNEVPYHFDKCNVGTNNVEEISVRSTPTLFFIEDKVIKNELRGFENIRDENLYNFFK